MWAFYPWETQFMPIQFEGGGGGGDLKLLALLVIGLPSLNETPQTQTNTNLYSMAWLLGYPAPIMQCKNPDLIISQY